MPWDTSSTSSQRERFAILALSASQPFTQICRDFQISRKTGYKWLKRFRCGGLPALEDCSRRPRKGSPGKTLLWKPRVEQARLQRPHWGARKLHQYLRSQYPRLHLPAQRTIGRWLEQLKLTRTRQRCVQRGPSVPHPGLTTPRRRHQVWTVDFKGWFRTADGQRQEPLTVREAKSRYVLAIVLLANQGDAGVRQAMRRLFAREGLPTAIRVDNGAPFSSVGALGLSRLSVWWLRLGIRVEFTRRARPGDNAAHEQMHRCYKAETLRPPAASRRSQQKRSDLWRQDYNQRRPHESLGQRTPASCYAPSKRKLPSKLPQPDCPSGCIMRKVGMRGLIGWNGRKHYIGVAFGGQQLGFKPLSTLHYAVYLGRLLIGELHIEDVVGMRPAHWKREPSTPLKV